jgi:HSP20 family protein
VDPNGIQAHFDRGVLEITIPKPEERKPRRVAINVGGRNAAIEGTETGGEPDNSKAAPAGATS